MVHWHARKQSTHTYLNILNKPITLCLFDILVGKRLTGASVQDPECRSLPLPLTWAPAHTDSGFCHYQGQGQNGHGACLFFFFFWISRHDGSFPLNTGARVCAAETEASVQASLSMENTRHILGHWVTFPGAQILEWLTLAKSKKWNSIFKGMFSF